ncbi:MAG: hypothetical protein IPL65_18480 [Lewinellaceae bacterium]|nr:hypothetical protein [Lewinellaceae bacterium]
MIETAIVYNGEVYNYRELRTQLPEYPFVSSSDTEVLLAGFAAWGTALFEKLNGIFSLPCTTPSREVCTWRDRFWCKAPVFPNQPGMLHPGFRTTGHPSNWLVEQTVSEEALSDSFANGVVTGEQRLCG